MSEKLTINEIPNPYTKCKFKPIKEKMDIYLPGIKNENISRRNGMIEVMSGSGGSGKTCLELNMFKSAEYYRGIFHNIYFFCPESSFLSVVDHPFKGHDKLYNLDKWRKTQ